MSGRRLWKHRIGDQYRAVLCKAWMNESGYGFSYYSAGQRQSSLANAKRDGFAAAESDDFNIWVYRDNAFVAVLWMNELLDDEPEVLASITAEACFEVNA